MGTDQIIDMDAVAAELRSRGHFAYVEQTGGGCATIYAGPTHTDEHGDERYAAVAGPGSFAGPGWTNAQGDPDDFWIGPDDDGDTSPSSPDPAASAAEIADMLAAIIEQAS